MLLADRKALALFARDRNKATFRDGFASLRPPRFIPVYVKEGPTVRCRYFTLEHKQVTVIDLPLILPVCRCALTELMLERLRTHPDGESLLPYLEGPPLDDDTPRPVIGADQQPISPQTCTEQRKESQCIPGFVELLTDLGLDTRLPPET